MSFSITMITLPNPGMPPGLMTKKRFMGKYMAAEEVCEALSLVIKDSQLVKDATFVFDGFTGFTPVQMTAMRALMPRKVH